MTDRYNSLTVALERDIRDDDAENLVRAIRQLRGVLAVTGNISTPDAWIAGERAKNELRQKLWDVLYPDPTCGGTRK